MREVYNWEEFETVDLTFLETVLEGCETVAEGLVVQHLDGVMEVCGCGWMEEEHGIGCSSHHNC